MKKVVVLAAVFGLVGTSIAHQPEGELEFVVQFPDEAVPSVDGNDGDWGGVPSRYLMGSDQLYNSYTEEGRGQDDRSDMNITHMVGWNDNLNKLYFLTRVFDNVHNTDRADPGPFYKDDALEIEVDTQHKPQSEQNVDVADRIAYKFAVPPVSDAYYFTRPVAGVAAWLAPGTEWVDFGWSFDGDEFGESTYTYELAITPIESFPKDEATAQDGVTVWDLEEGDVIHLSINVGDIDAGDDYHGFHSLSPTSWNTDFALDEIASDFATAVETDTWARIKAQFK
jgi:hypothetical protein